MGIQKAKLNVRTNKKGKVIGEREFSPNSTMPVPPQIALRLDLNNKECEGKELQRNVAPNSNQTSSQHQAASGQSYRRSNQGAGRQSSIPQRNVAQSATSSAESVARAPYNFIPLNKTVIEGQSTVDFSAYHEDRLSGYIQCEIETVTPLYIRDTLDEEQLSRDLESNGNPDFFSPAGKYRIPGSSLRGMVRNLVEIISWGKFCTFGDKLLFYRGLADQSNLRDEYQANMSSYDRNARRALYKFNAGYIKREGVNSYCIVPAKIEEGRQFRQVRKIDPNRKFEFERRADGKTLVISGPMPRKKHDWLINAPDTSQKIKIPYQDILAYKSDESRYRDNSPVDNRHKHDGDLLRMLSVDDANLVPCFYVLWEDDQGSQRVSFGHTGYFRLAYKQTIGQHVPSQLRNTSKTDIVESIFGKLGVIASRVYFEDATPLDSTINLALEAKQPKVLSTPKPTTFQHYLRQPDLPNIKSLKHWNSDCDIRGYKLYWHKYQDNTTDPGEFDWEDNNAVEDRIHTRIKPILPKTKFTGRIRFDNLTKEELGALLFALDLPENHYHKLGMGKPLGLGTVKITPKLHLCDRKKRYSELFAEDDWQLAENTADIKTYKDAFEKYILDRLSNEEKGAAKSLWEVTRLKHLKAMMEEPTNPDWNEITSYMQIEPRNEYKMRPVLPDPLKVKQQNRGRR